MAAAAVLELIQRSLRVDKLSKAAEQPAFQTMFQIA
jgi:hypothetical protein